MTIRRPMLFLAACVGLSACLNAQDTLRITLTQAVSRALERNPAVRIAEKEAAKAHAAESQALAVILPRVDAYASLQHAWEIQKNRIPNFLKPMLAPLGPVLPGIDQMPDFVELSFGLENTVVYGATLTQPLFLGGAGLAAIRTADAAGRAADHNLELRKQQILFETARTFYLCLMLRQVGEVQEDALRQARANFDLVTKKFDVGMASRFDRMRAEVEVARLEPEVLTARNNYEASLTQLKSLLALDLLRPLVPIGKLESDLSVAGSSIQELQNLAEAERPELKAVQERKAIAQHGITLARSDFFPRIVFQTDYSFLAMKDNLRLQQDDFSKGFTSSVSLQLPLFGGFESRSRLNQAQLDLRMTGDLERQVRDGIRAEVEISFQKLREASQKTEAARKTVDLATEALRLANVLYDEGANTQLDVLNSRLALTSAQLSLLTASYEFVMARYQLRKATGTLSGV